jgi:hypothetical protein
VKDLTREQLAFELFKIMNADSKRFWGLDGFPGMWSYFQKHGWHQGYLRIADHIIQKGYKP